MAGLTIAIRRNRIQEVSETLRREAREHQVKTAERVRDRARQNVHVVTGRLRDSIQVDAARGTGRKPEGERVIAIVAGAPYASFEEEGTRYRPPHPFLRPALESQRGPYVHGFSTIGSRL